MKKFYKTAESGTAPGGHVVRLDGKVVKTPLHHPLIVASEKLAAEMAAEWMAQGDDIDPASMPLTQLANTMVDKGRGRERSEMEQTLIDYGASDLVCYFATHPEEVVARQKKHWQTLLDWLRDEYAITLESVSGIQYHHQPPESLQAAAATAGSLVIALALLRGKLSAERAYEAACVDEIYQLEKWGEDKLARERLDALKAELISIEKFRDLVTASS